MIILLINLKTIKIKCRGNGSGALQILIGEEKKKCAEIDVSTSSEWKEYSVDVNIPGGVYALHIKYVGKGKIDVKSIEFI